MTTIYEQPIAPFFPIWQESGFTKPTPIQQAVYWPIKKGQPVLGLAATGKGKTLAFGLPLLETLQPGQGTQLIILEPSAELVMQVRDVLQPYAKAVNLKVQGVVGKANPKRQLEQLKKHPEIVVATTGRFTELLQNRVFKVDRISALVIDEADLQLDTEHLEQTRDLITSLQADTQIILMSATEQAIFTELAKWFGYEFERYDTRAEDRAHLRIKHYFYVTNNQYKAELLKQLSRGPLASEAALVFVKNRGSAKTLVKTLHFLNLSVGLLLGDESSQQRQKVMREFRQHTISYLITTDLAARGLDFAALSFVVNYDLPTNKISYIHRSGRTGRMDHDGTVLNFGNEHDRRDLQKQLAPEYELTRIYLADKQLTPIKPVHEAVLDQTVEKVPEDNWSKPEKKQDKTPKTVKNGEKSIKSGPKGEQKPTHRKKRLRDRKNIGKPKHKNKSKNLV